MLTPSERKFLVDLVTANATGGEAKTKFFLDKDNINQLIYIRKLVGAEALDEELLYARKVASND